MPHLSRALCGFFFFSELRTVFFVANRRHSAAVCPVWKHIWHFAWDFGEPCPVQLQLRFKCPAPPHAWQVDKSRSRPVRGLEVGASSFSRRWLMSRNMLKRWYYGPGWCSNLLAVRLRPLVLWRKGIYIHRPRLTLLVAKHPWKI